MPSFELIFFDLSSIADCASVPVNILTSSVLVAPARDYLCLSNPETISIGRQYLLQT
jgi:hypothetical protein